MNVTQARALLQSSPDNEEPVVLPRAILSQLTIDDLPEGVSINIGTSKDRIIHLDWNGKLYREGAFIMGEADHTWTRKYWYAPLGLEQYLDLVRRAVETRERTQHDVRVTHQDDDGACVQLMFSIRTTDRNIGQAYENIQRISAEVEEAAQQAVNEIDRRIAEIAARLSGWGSESIDSLVDRVDAATSSDEKGRSLEELCARLFHSVPGFSVTQRIRTATEEIDIAIRNDSSETPFNREEALILAECKNWSGKCGKDEFVLFLQKIENRSQRCSLGFLISWNGFAVTVTKEMLRGSRERSLIVPLEGKDLREAVRGDSFADVLKRCWDRAVSV